MLQELAYERENQDLKNICQQHPDRERCKIHLPGTQIQHQRQRPRQGDSKKNHGRMGSIRQTPRHLQGYHWDRLEETSLQVMRIFSNDIRRGNMDTHYPSKEQASSRANKDRKENVKHHIPGQKKTSG